MPNACEQHLANIVKIEAHEKRLDSHSAKLDAITEQTSKLTQIVEQQTELLKEVKKGNEALIREIKLTSERQMAKLEERIVALENVPAKRWETIIAVVLTSIVSAVMGAIITHVTWLAPH